MSAAADDIMMEGPAARSHVSLAALPLLPDGVLLMNNYANAKFNAKASSAQMKF